MSFVTGGMFLQNLAIRAWIFANIRISRKNKNDRKKSMNCEVRLPRMENWLRSIVIAVNVNPLRRVKKFERFPIN
jgi:hypothetical protein